MTATRNNAFVKLANSSTEESSGSGIYEPVIAGTMEFVFTVGGDIVIAQAVLLKED